MQEKLNSTLIGFDYGLRKIGVSIGNTVSGVASPLKILYSKSKIEGFKAAKEEIFFWDPEFIVVGFPSHLDGRTHPLANNCKRFARNISFETGKKGRKSYKPICETCENIIKPVQPLYKDLYLFKTI